MQIADLPASVLVFAVSSAANFASRALSLLAETANQTPTPIDQWFGNLTSMGSTGALIWILVNVIPKMQAENRQIQKENREERAAAELARVREREIDRAEMAAHREKYVCHAARA